MVYFLMFRYIQYYSIGIFRKITVPCGTMRPGNSDGINSIEIQ